MSARAPVKNERGRGSDHHLLRRRQLQFRVVADDPVDVPLEAREIHDVAVMVMSDVAAYIKLS